MDKALWERFASPHDLAAKPRGCATDEAVAWAAARPASRAARRG